MASQVAQSVKNPPAMQETWVWSLGQEDPLEKEMATHSSILFFSSWAVYLLLFFFIVEGFVIHWNESAMDLHVFPILIPTPTSLSTRSL